MGCYSSKLEDETEFYIDHDIAPTVISSLNASTSPTMSTKQYKSKVFMYSSTKFLKIKSIAALNFNSLPNKEELFQILDNFEYEVYEVLERSTLIPAEISITLSESSRQDITISVQAEGIRKFNFLNVFLQKMQKYMQNKEQCKNLLQEHSEFIMELAPLTVSFYLSLGEEIDFGIGIVKPIDRKNLSRFLQNSSDRKIITEWSYLGSMPIPVSLQFSCLKIKKSCQFYIFDGEKRENFQRAFAIFDYIGAPVRSDLKECFFTAKSEEAYCTVTLEPRGITQISVEISNLSSEATQLAADFLKIEFPHKLSGDLLKVSLELDSKGMNLITHIDI